MFKRFLTYISNTLGSIADKLDAIAARLEANKDKYRS